MQIYLFVLIQAAQYDFMYGVQYAWNLVVFNLVMTYSLTTPVIVPFGELYMLAPEPFEYTHTKCKGPCIWIILA